MSINDDFIGRLEDYLETFDGPTPLPDRVRDAIRAELPSARQVRPRPGFERVFPMLSNTSTLARLGLGAAAIAVAVVFSGAILNNGRSGGIVGGAPGSAPPASVAPSLAPTLSASPAATSAPSAAVAPLRLKEAPFARCDTSDTNPATCVVPGRYQLNDWPGPSTWPMTVTVDVPEGWFDWDAAAGIDAVLVDGGPEARGGSGWGVLFASVGDVARDPCDATKGTIPAGQIKTPQQLATAMAAWPKFTATTPTRIVVDGHDGLQLDLTSTAAKSCDTTGKAWVTTSGGIMNVYPMVSSTDARAAGTFQIVDTGHGLLVIRYTDFPQTSPAEVGDGLTLDPTRHAADQVKLHAILDSIRLGAPAAS